MTQANTTNTDAPRLQKNNQEADSAVQDLPETFLPPRMREYGKHKLTKAVVKAMKDEVSCKNKIRKIIEEVVGMEMNGVKQDIQDLKRMVLEEGMNNTRDGIMTCSEAAVKEEKRKRK
ncbi:hypothetical protein M0804_000205 [Polistes exclamans]|nr:hypothetical protein M0804_000205 [Polistes exclamans]